MSKASMQNIQQAGANGRMLACSRILLDFRLLLRKGQ
jgi:hypothetical protein